MSTRAAEIGAKILRNLAAQAASNHADAQARRAEIRRVMTEYTGPEHLTAKLVQQKLGGDPPLSIRAIQDHMKTINAESSASR